MNLNIRQHSIKINANCLGIFLKISLKNSTEIAGLKTHRDQNEGQQVLDLITWFFDIYFDDCLS